MQLWLTSPLTSFAAASCDIYSKPEGKSSVPKTGEPPTYVNTQHIDAQVLAALQAEMDPSPEGGLGAVNRDSPRKDVFDMSKSSEPLTAATDRLIIGLVKSLFPELHSCFGQVMFH